MIRLNVRGTTAVAKLLQFIPRTAAFPPGARSLDCPFPQGRQKDGVMVSSWAALGAHPGYFTDDLAAPRSADVRAGGTALCRDFPTHPDLV